MKRSAALRIWLTASMCSFALPARAGVEETFGLNSRAIALGGAYTAPVCDTSAAYYNPAGLGRFPRWKGGDPDGRGGDSLGLSIDIGTFYGTPQLSYRISGSAEVEGGAPSAAGGTYGISLDLGRAVGLPYTALGLLIYSPYETLFAYTVENITRPNWIRYSDGYDHLSFYPAFAFSPSKYFSIGLGLRFSLELETQSNARCWIEDDPEKDILERTHIEMGEEINISSNFAFLFGITVRPIENLKLAFVFREGTQVHDWGHTLITDIPVLMFVMSYEYDHLLSHYYHPTQFEFGACWEDDLWLATITVSHNVWDDFLDAYRDPALPGFDDTTTFRVGGGINLHSSTRLLLGYAFEPSPVPEQSMISNFLDCDRHILSLGGTTRIDELLGLGPRISLSAHFQLQILPERSYKKDVRAIRKFYRERLENVKWEDEDGNEVGLDPEEQDELADRYTDRVVGTNSLSGGGYPSFTYSGFFYSLGLTLSFEF